MEKDGVLKMVWRKGGGWGKFWWKHPPPPPPKTTNRFGIDLVVVVICSCYYIYIYIFMLYIRDEKKFPKTVSKKKKIFWFVAQTLFFPTIVTILNANKAAHRVVRDIYGRKGNGGVWG